MYPEPELFFSSEEELRREQHTLAEHLATGSCFRLRNSTEKKDWSTRKRGGYSSVQNSLFQP